MPPSAAYAADPYSYAAARAVADDLGLSEPVAVTLVRRGYTTPDLARAFLAAEEAHPPSAFAGMEEAVDLVLAAIESEARITVHGDFDVDGVCATALLVSTLRGLDADADWLIPDRLKDGYGLGEENVRRLADRGTNLLITVDCGITAVEQVELAKSLGMEVLVTDHHQRAEQLPACPILHPEVSEYPFESLCGTAVAWKLAIALREATGTTSPGAPPDLDLVALATIADLVPLVGENRSLAKQGLAEMRLAQRPGLRALIAASKCEPTQLDESDVGFRLAPRINAAGRLYRADAGVELLLTDDEERAEQIAVELSRANSERRATEREVDAAAEAARRELPDDLRAASGLVLAGEGWHPGVVGIVASRLVERHNRPVVVISLDGEGGARGSGRSIPGFDLLEALRACAEHLGDFGGHRAAAGVSLRADQLAGFQRAFAAHATAVLGPEPPARTERFDALVGGVGLGLELAEELRQLAPFGLGNPGVRLMVPSAKVSDVRTMGAEGKHSRFSLHSGAHRALGVAFGRSDLGVESDEPVDAAIRLEVNHWNGSVEPRVVLRELYPVEGGGAGAEPSGRSAAEAEPRSGGKRDAAGAEVGPRISSHPCECEPGEWWRRFEAELVREPGARSTDSTPYRGQDASNARAVVRGGGSAVVAIAELVSSGAGVLAVAADASRRAALAAGAAGLARFNGGSGRVACARCGSAAIETLAGKADGGLALTDYATLAAAPEPLAERFEHVVLVDPPTSAAEATMVAPRFVPVHPGKGAGYLHQLWTEAESDFALQALDESLASRDAVARVFRALREAESEGGTSGEGAGHVSGESLLAALTGGGAHPLAPESAARAFRVLAELELVQGEPKAGAGSVGVVSSEGTDLERSAAFRAYRARHLEAQRFLARPRQP